MLDDEKLIELLVRRDELLEQGRDATPEEVCKDCPELIAAYKARLEKMRGMDWMFETKDLAEEAGADPSVTASLDAYTLPDSSLSHEEFLQALSDSGLLSSEEVQELQNDTSKEPPPNPHSLASELILQRKLTHYQASVLLSQRSDPLLLDRYIILDAIGSGGMGVVFKALHRSMDRVVALKTLPASAVDSEEKVKRFQREVKTAAMLSHPNIVMTHDAHESNGVHFLVMEYVQGKDLRKVVEKRGPLPVTAAVDCVIQAARGLEHAHAQGIVHRDIKPGNLLLDRDGTVKVLGMGLARLKAPQGADTETEEQLTSAGGVMGTASFMSPEQAINTHDVDARSDIYSLGCTLYFLLTGQPPYKKENTVSTILAHRDEPIPPLSENRDDIPEEVIAAYRRMMAKKPEDRFQTMGEVIRALSEFGAVPANDAQRQAFAASSHEPPSRSHKRLWWGTGVAGMLCSLAVLFILLRPWNTGDGPTTATLQHDKLPPATSHSSETLADNIAPPDSAKATTETPPEGVTATKPLPGLLSDPEDLPGVGRWQLETVMPRSESRSVAWNPKGKLLAIGMKTGTIRIYEMAEKVELAAMCVGHTDEVLSLRWHPEGTHLASASLDGTIRLWLPDGTPHRVMTTDSGERIASVAWHPKGQILVSGGYDRTVRFWDIEGNPGKVLQGHSAAIKSLAWSPDGQTLASGSNDATVRLWAADGSLKKETNGLEGPVLGLDWHPNGQRFATSSDSSVRIFSDAGTEEHVMTGHDTYVRDVAFSPDGKLLASTDRYQTVRLWKVDGTPGPVLKPEAETSQSWALAWSPSGDSVAQAVGNGCWIWRLDRPEVPQRIQDRTFAARSIVPDREGKWLAVGLASSAPGVCSIRLVTEDGSLGATRDVYNTDSMAWGPDGHRILTSSGGPATRIVSIRTPEEVTLSGHTEHIFGVAWSPDGNVVATASADKTIRLWDTAGTTIRVLDGHAGFVRSLDFDPTGEILASCGDDQSVRLWPVHGGNAQILTGHEGAAKCVAWSPTARQLASGSDDGTVRLWTADGTPGPVLSAGSAVSSVAWSPGGEYLAAGILDHGRVMVWSKEGEHVRTFSTAARSITSVGWTHDGKRLVATGDTDGTVHLWNIANGEVTWTRMFFDDGTSVGFDATGQFLGDDPKVIERELVYVVEQPSGKMDILRPSEFSYLVARDASSQGDEQYYFPDSLTRLTMTGKVFPRCDFGNFCWHRDVFFCPNIGGSQGTFCSISHPIQIAA